jgi:predicted RNase H-like HicB family nuclease
MSKINKTMDKLKYQMIIQWSEKDDCFLVGLPDFPGQKWRTHGETYEEAVANGKEALESLIISYGVDGESLPEPSIYRMVS